MWTATRNGKRVDVSGPVGDTLKLQFTSRDDDYDWTGWTWLGQVRQTPSSAVVATFTFADSSTSTQLNVIATVANTSSWTAGDSMVYAIQGTKNSESYTFLEGAVIPTENIAY